MDMKSIKQFKKPNIQKLVLSLIIFIILSNTVSVFYIETPVWCGLGNSTGPCGMHSEFVGLYKIFYYISIKNSSYQNSYYNIPFETFIDIFYFFILSYLISSGVIFIWDKIRNKINNK